MGENVWNRISREAAADLSAKQFYAVKSDSTGKAALCDTAGEFVLGVLANKPTSGQMASIDVAGITQMIAGGTIQPQGAVKVDSAGKAVAAVAGRTDTTSGSDSATTPLIGSNVFGRFVGTAAAATGDIIEVLITREGVVPGTAS